jgi:hypothetical protein
MLNKTKNAIEIVMLGLIIGLTPEIVMGSAPPFYEQHKLVQEIAKDTSTPEKKAKVVVELSDIVEDKTGEIHLRQFAAEKLGEIQAIEAKDMLKTLAEELDWSDENRQLKRVTTLAYWKIRVAVEPNAPTQQAMLTKLLFGETSPPPHADVVPSWAADELANRGVKEALPLITKSIKSRLTGERADLRIWLCQTKIELLTTNASRYDALATALVTMDDRTPYGTLKKWAIEELGKEKEPDDGRWVLLAYALDLQKKCYDGNGKWKLSRTDPLARNATDFYKTIIKILKDSGMSDMTIKAMGLRQDKYFISA